MLHILWREVAGVATLEDTLSGLSALADQLLDAAAGFAARQLCERYGVIRNEHGEPVSIVILGMGKLGGKELNFSSDIDLIFLFPSGTDSDGRKCLSAQEYFTRLSRHVVALLDEVTADGFVFRIDTRLRPFGDSGPPVVNYAALESYLLQHGRGWERYAYVKARIVGPQPVAAVVDELYAELISPFVYRRYLDFGVFESLRDMQGLIAAEVKRRELADNIKLGPGGIRAIEFIVQSLQLVRGGSRPDLQDRELLSVLPKLVGGRGLTQADAEVLRDAYQFLRRLENFIQAIRDQPADP
jgi:glutamate-ammonia-ligase adenylyltransferase